MNKDIANLKRRGSLIAEGVATSGGGGAAYLEGVAASALATRQRCVCGCSLPADARIPADVIIDKLRLKSFLYKMLADDKEKCERLLDAFAVDAKSAQNSYRIASFHLDGGGGGGGAAAAPASRDVYMLRFSPDGRTPSVFPQPTPAFLSDAPGKDEDAARLLSKVKAKLDPDEFAGVETIIAQLRIGFQAEERVREAEKDKHERAIAALQQQQRELQRQLDATRKQVEDLREAEQLFAWQVLRAFSPPDDEPPDAPPRSPHMRWDKVKSLGPKEIVALTGLHSAQFLELLMDWMNADGWMDQQPLLRHEYIQNKLSAGRDVPIPQPEEASAANGHAPVYPAARDCALPFAAKGPGGRQRALSNYDWLFLYFFILRSGCTYALAAYFFNLDTSTVGVYFTTMAFMIEAWMTTWCPMPDVDALKLLTPPHLGESLAGTAKVAVFVGDTTGFFMQNSEHKRYHAMMWSDYYHGEVLKFHVTCGALGGVMHVSDGFGGSVTDDDVATRSGVLEQIPPASVLLLDRGYPRATFHASRREIRVQQPAWMHRNPDQTNVAQLTHEQAEATLAVASPRNVMCVTPWRLLSTFFRPPTYTSLILPHSERVIGRVKQIWPWTTLLGAAVSVDLQNAVVRSCFLLTNFWGPLSNSAVEHA